MSRIIFIDIIAVIEFLLNPLTLALDFIYAIKNCFDVEEFKYL